MIIIKCDQSKCKFNKEEEHLHPNKHDVITYACTHQHPDLSYNIRSHSNRNCMSKQVKS